MDRHAINRLYNAVDQFILKLVDFNKVIVHADSGKVISLQQALKLGIVDKVVPLAELNEAALKILNYFTKSGIFIQTGGIEDMFDSCESGADFTFFLFFIQEKNAPAKQETKEVSVKLSLKELPANLRFFIIVSSVFALGHFGYAFLLLRAKNIGLADNTAIFRADILQDCYGIK